MDVSLCQALKDAVKSNQKTALQSLLSEFPDELERKLKSPQLLHIAIINSAVDVIPFLLDQGADINSVYNGDSSLTQAEDVHVLELLLSRGADPNVKIRSSSHTYPLHKILSSECQYNLMKTTWRSLLSRGSLFRFLNDKIHDFAQCLLKYGAQVDLQDGWGRTALSIAVYECRSVRTVKLLIDAGADVNKMDDGGKTPLLKAECNLDYEVIKCLIDAGADVNLICKSTGKTVIFETTDKTTLGILLDNGADVKTIGGDSPLNSLLAKHNIGTESVRRLIDAGCDLNHENSDGYTAIIHAAKYVDIELLELLVQKGADVNASGRKFPYKTAVTAILKKLWNNAKCGTSCFNYLLDQNATIDKVHPSVIHVFITSGCLSLIPRFISNGLTPTYLLIEKTGDLWFPFKTHISPLMVALLLNQSDLAQYFININYLMKSDIDVLNGNMDTQVLLEKESAINSLELLNTVSQQPLSLKTLCFVALSDTLGRTQDRRLKVQKLGLPQPMQDLLLFKNVIDDGIQNTDIRNLFRYKQSLNQLHLYDLKDSDHEEDSGARFLDSD